MKITTLSRAIITLLFPVVALALVACWTAPSANVQPKGEARLIQSAIPVESVKRRLTVQSINAEQRVIVLNAIAGVPATFNVGTQAPNLYRIQTGDQVQVTVVQELTIYVAKNGEVPGIGGKPEALQPDARVLEVDPSYRLLTLQYPNGRAETFKVGLDVRLLEMQPGDVVVVRPKELIAVRGEKP
jgi:translation initiation factor IF-1